MAVRQVDRTEPYLEKLKKLIPAEIAAAFIAINSIIPFQSPNTIYIYVSTAILVLGCFLYLRQQQSVTDVKQLLFTSLIAFPVWALNIAIARFDWISGQEFIAAVVLILVTVFSPLIFPTPASAPPAPIVAPVIPATTPPPTPLP
jgi:hypothetical protein